MELEGSIGEKVLEDHQKGVRHVESFKAKQQEWREERARKIEKVNTMFEPYAKVQELLKTSMPGWPKISKFGPYSRWRGFSEMYPLNPPSHESLGENVFAWLGIEGRYDRGKKGAPKVVSDIKLKVIIGAHDINTRTYIGSLSRPAEDESEIPKDYGLTCPDEFTEKDVISLIREAYELKGFIEDSWKLDEQIVSHPVFR